MGGSQGDHKNYFLLIADKDIDKLQAITVPPIGNWEAKPRYEVRFDGSWHPDYPFHGGIGIAIDKVTTTCNGDSRESVFRTAISITGDLNPQRAEAAAAREATRVINVCNNQQHIEINVMGDSESTILGLKGAIRCGDQITRATLEEAKGNIRAQYRKVKFHTINRENNSEADLLAKAARIKASCTSNGHIGNTVSMSAKWGFPTKMTNKEIVACLDLILIPQDNNVHDLFTDNKQIWDDPLKKGRVKEICASLLSEHIVFPNIGDTWAMVYIILELRLPTEDPIQLIAQKLQATHRVGKKAGTKL